MDIVYKPKEIFIKLVAECGVTPTKIWVKAMRETLITADIMDTMDILSFTNLYRNTDTIFVRR